MNLDNFFKSELTLNFDETRIKEISHPIEINDVGKLQNFTIRHSIYIRIVSS